MDACVQLLEDLKIRADFINKLRMFYETLNILEHRPEVPGDVFRDAKLLGFINKVAANLYRDPALNLLGVAEKVKALIDAHVSARGVDPKIPPTTITDAEFEKVLQAQTSSRARAAQMQHAARYHIIGFSNQNPAYARKMSEKLEEILQRFKDDWDALERELRKFIEELRQGDRNDFPDLDPKVQVPFVRLVLEECGKGRELERGPAHGGALGDPGHGRAHPAGGAEGRLLEEQRHARVADADLWSATSTGRACVLPGKSAIWRSGWSRWPRKTTRI